MIVTSIDIDEAENILIRFCTEHQSLLATGNNLKTGVVAIVKNFGSLFGHEPVESLWKTASWPLDSAAKTLLSKYLLKQKSTKLS